MGRILGPVLTPISWNLCCVDGSAWTGFLAWVAPPPMTAPPKPTALPPASHRSSWAAFGCGGCSSRGRGRLRRRAARDCSSGRREDRARPPAPGAARRDDPRAVGGRGCGAAATTRSTTGTARWRRWRRWPGPSTARLSCRVSRGHDRPHRGERDPPAGHASGAAGGCQRQSAVGTSTAVRASPPSVIGRPTPHCPTR
jgi:hypothetical protein